MGYLIRKKMIYRDYVRLNFPHTLYLFGDNMKREGFGGQAREMRGEPNAIGVPTKWLPSNSPQAFFSDNMSHEEGILVKNAIDFSFDLAALWISQPGKDVCVPSDGLGTGLSKLPEKAPNILKYIDMKIAKLGQISGGLLYE
jgi:hypothetical protein